MSIINIFTQQAPTLAGYSFDAVLEDTIDASVEWTTYPVESGVNVNDHRIIQPIQWSLTGAVSNNPLQPQLTDFLSGAASKLVDNPYVATIAGLSAGFLAGSAGTRASSTLLKLIELMVSGEPFDIDAGDIQLSNMVISRIGRTRDPSNENGLLFTAELQELITIDRLVSLDQPRQTQLRDGDVAKSGMARIVNKGRKVASDAPSSVSKEANIVLDGGI